MLGKGDPAGSLHGFIPGGRAGAGSVAAGQTPQEWQDLALLCFSVCFFSSVIAPTSRIHPSEGITGIENLRCSRNFRPESRQRSKPSQNSAMSWRKPQKKRGEVHYIPSPGHLESPLCLFHVPAGFSSPLGHDPAADPHGRRIWGQPARRRGALLPCHQPRHRAESPRLTSC